MNKKKKDNNSSFDEEVKAEEKDERYANTFWPSQRLSNFQKLRPLWKRQGTIIGDLTPPKEHEERKKKTMTTTKKKKKKKRKMSDMLIHFGLQSTTVKFSKTEATLEKVGYYYWRFDTPYTANLYDRITMELQSIIVPLLYFAAMFLYI